MEPLQLVGLAGLVVGDAFHFAADPVRIYDRRVDASNQYPFIFDCRLVRQSGRWGIVWPRSDQRVSNFVPGRRTKRLDVLIRCLEKKSGTEKQARAGQLGKEQCDFAKLGFRRRPFHSCHRGNPVDSNSSLRCLPVCRAWQVARRDVVGRNGDLGCLGQLRISDDRHDVSGSPSVGSQYHHFGFVGMGGGVCVSGLAKVDASHFPGPRCHGALGHRYVYGHDDVWRYYDYRQHGVSGTSIDTKTRRPSFQLASDGNLTSCDT